MTDITFHNIRTGASIQDGHFNFGFGRFETDHRAWNEEKEIKFFEPQRLVILDYEEYSDFNDIQPCLFDAYEKTIDVLAKLSYKHQTYAYMDIPIRCTYLGKDYILREEMMFEEIEKIQNIQIIGGGKLCRDLDFINRRKFFKHYLYREAQDDTNLLDYRVLQLWRFLEKHFRLKDGALIKKLQNIGTFEVIKGKHKDTGKIIIETKPILKSFISRYYRSSRCGVSHGGGSGKGQSKIVQYPRIYHSDKLFFDFLEMNDIVDYIIREKIR